MIKPVVLKIIRSRRFSLRIQLALLIAVSLILACILYLHSSIVISKNTNQIEQIITEIDDLKIDGLREYTNIIEDLLLRQNDKFASNNTVIALLIIWFGMSASFFVAIRVIKPVTALSKEMSRISENNLKMRVVVPNSKDEIATLAIVFNKMIDKLEKAFESQKNFSADAAHELRTPLTAMIANIEVCQLNEQPSLQEYRDTLDEVLQNAGRLETLVNDLLMMNAANNVILYEIVDARELTERIIVELTPIAGGIRFYNQIGSIKLMGNEFLLYRAFFNLLHNAVKYNKPGGEVIVDGMAMDNMSVITVSDTGIGIPTEQIDKIFNSFYCVDKSRSRELGGSGLGLAIVKSIIEKHNGRIDVRSEPGVSTTFTVCLPK